MTAARLIVGRSYRRGTPCVYLLEDANGEVIYIGRSIDLRNRLKSHSKKHWWSEVAGGWHMPAETLTEARLIERESIERYRPKYNQNDVVPLTACLDMPDECGALLCMYEDAGVARMTDQYMLRLHNAGWTLASIGKPLGITRERVRQRIKGLALDPDIEVPDAPQAPPRRKPKPPKVGRWESRPEIPADDVQRLKDLHVLAKRCRGWTPEDSPIRAASVELAEAQADLMTRGFSAGQIAKAMGVTRAAVLFRLQRFGYTDHGSTTAKRYIGSPAAAFTPQSHCKAGHPLSGDNLGVMHNGKRWCRECDRRRGAEYMARKKAVSA